MLLLEAQGDSRMAQVDLPKFLLDVGTGPGRMVVAFSRRNKGNELE